MILDDLMFFDFVSQTSLKYQFMMQHLTILTLDSIPEEMKKVHIQHTHMYMTDSEQLGVCCATSLVGVSDN